MVVFLRAHPVRVTEIHTLFKAGPDCRIKPRLLRLLHLHSMDCFSQERALKTVLFSFVINAKILCRCGANRASWISAGTGKLLSTN